VTIILERKVLTSVWIVRKEQRRQQGVWRRERVVSPTKGVGLRRKVLYFPLTTLCFGAFWVLFESCINQQGAVSIPQGPEIWGAKEAVKVAIIKSNKVARNSTLSTPNNLHNVLMSFYSSFHAKKYWRKWIYLCEEMMFRSTVYILHGKCWCEKCH